MINSGIAGGSYCFKNWVGMAFLQNPSLLFPTLNLFFNFIEYCSLILCVSITVCFKKICPLIFLRACWEIMFGFLA